MSTTDLDRVANASLSIPALDTLYVLPGIFYAVIFLLILTFTYYNKNDWNLFKEYSVWAIAIVPSTTYALLIVQRSAWSRYLGLLLDGILTVLIISFAIIAATYSVYAGLVVLLFAFFPGRALQARYQYPLLYGPDRVSTKTCCRNCIFVGCTTLISCCVQASPALQHHR